jgi:hypothetical protein
VVVLAVLVPAAFGIRADFVRKAQQAAYDDATARRQVISRRWNALVATEPCARTVATDEALVREMMKSGAYRTDGMISVLFERLASGCLDGPMTLRADEATSPKARRALGAWIDAEARLAGPSRELGEYFSHDDWKEDAFRGADEKWKALAPLLDARRGAVQVVVRDALGELRDEIRTRARAREAQKGKDEVVFRIDLGLRLWEVSSRAEELAVNHAGDNAKALEAAVRTLRDEAKVAPLEVRRDLRRLDYLLDPIAEGAETTREQLYSVIRPNPDLLRELYGTAPGLPELPPKPEYHD